MTWVIGGKHVFCARALSDVQVTFTQPNGMIKYLDGLKKVHKITDKITLIFAGAIEVALEVIGDVKLNFTAEDCWHDNPNYILNKLVKFIKFSYEKSIRKHNHNSVNYRVDFLLIVNPNRLYGSFGMWKLQSPKFSPVSPSEPFEMLELGSGSVIADYRDIAKRHAQGLYIVEKEDGELPDGIIATGKQGLRFVYEEAMAYQNAGVSRAMHITLATHRGVFIELLPESPYVAFPHTVETWEELMELAKIKGITTANCDAQA